MEGTIKGMPECGALVWSIWNIKYWLWTSKFDAGRQFDGFWRPTSIFDVLSQIFDVQHQFLTSYVKSGVNIWCPASIFDAEHQIFDVGRQIFDVGRQIFDVAHQIFDARRQILTRDVKYWCRTSKTIKLTSNIKIWRPMSIFDITDASHQYVQEKNETIRFYFIKGVLASPAYNHKSPGMNIYICRD